MTGKPGADSYVPITSQIGGKSLIRVATELYGEPPAFWGRYFSSLATRGSAEYRRSEEGDALREAGIRVLPIARQTRRVGGSESDGAADAVRNSEDILTTFGIDCLARQGGSLFVFLDVEGDPRLSVAYYTGWAETLKEHSAEISGGSASLVPCVYAAQKDVATWTALSAACRGGIPCGGAWVARWRNNPSYTLPPWDDAFIQPTIALPCPILLWQYAANCHGSGGFDCSQTNPQLDFAYLQSHLVLPPAREVKTS